MRERDDETKRRLEQAIRDGLSAMLDGKIVTRIEDLPWVEEEPKEEKKPARRGRKPKKEPEPDPAPETEPEPEGNELVLDPFRGDDA